MATPRRSWVGSVSLAVAVVGAVAAHLALRTGPFADATWLRILGAGFEAAVVGGLADWFAVTALCRHPHPDSAHGHHPGTSRQDDRVDRGHGGGRVALARGHRP